jgi:SAM-dependent methyltransferase
MCRTDNVAELERVLEFWNANPVAAAAVPHPLYSNEYFDEYDHLRELNESVAFSYRLHEYRSFSGKKVLDVGCGNGYVLSRYAEEGADVYGVDLTPTAIELTRTRFALRGLTGTFELANAEARGSHSFGRLFSLRDRFPARPCWIPSSVGQSSAEVRPSNRWQERPSGHAVSC